MMRARGSHKFGLSSRKVLRIQLLNLSDTPQYAPNFW